MNQTLCGETRYAKQAVVFSEKSQKWRRNFSIIKPLKTLNQGFRGSTRRGIGIAKSLAVRFAIFSSSKPSRQVERREWDDPAVELRRVREDGFGGKVQLVQFAVA